MSAIIGKKLGMGQFIQEDGTVTSVTYLLCEPNEVVQVKSLKKNDNADGVVLGAFPLKHPKKTRKFRVVRQFPSFEKDVEPGMTWSLSDLGEFSSVAITGRSKGRGFQGGVKRHNFRTARHTHGTKDHRHGSTWGQSARGGKTPKGIRMAGHMGNAQVTTRKRKVVRVDTEKNIVTLVGSVPGAINSTVILCKEV